MGRRILTLFMFVITLFSFTTGFAMNFNQPVKIGSYSNYRAGGPSQAIASGYTRATEDTFVFGTGKNALVFKYQNKYASGREASETKGVYVGENLVLTNTIGFPNIYMISSQEGDVFYLGIGKVAGLEQVFYLIGRCGGSYWTAVTIKDIAKICNDIQYLDTANAKILGEPYTQKDEIVVPYSIRYGQNLIEKGKLVFKWDSEAQWFSVNAVDRKG